MLYCKFLIVKQAKKVVNSRGGTVLHIVAVAAAKVSYQPVGVSQPLVLLACYRGPPQGLWTWCNAILPVVAARLSVHRLSDFSFCLLPRFSPDRTSSACPAWCPCPVPLSWRSTAIEVHGRSERWWRTGRPMIHTTSSAVLL